MSKAGKALSYKAIHNRLADALVRHAWACSTCNYECIRNGHEHIADVLLSLPGIAIVEPDAPLK